MPLKNIFTRKQADVAIQWKDDPALVKAKARLSELDATIKAAAEQLRYQHRLAVEAAEADVARAEMEILAGRSTDAVLAKAQAALIEAKRARAVTTIAHEDALAERAKVAEALPGIEKQAKLAAKASVQSRYLTVARELKATLEKVAELDARLQAVYNDSAQLNVGMYEPHDPDLPSRGGCREIGYAHIDRQVGLQVYVSPTGQVRDWIARVEEAIEAVEKAGGK